MVEVYSVKGDEQLRDVRTVLGLIDDLAAVADKLPELPRKKGERND